MVGIELWCIPEQRAQHCSLLLLKVMVRKSAHLRVIYRPGSTLSPSPLILALVQDPDLLLSPEPGFPLSREQEGFWEARQQRN